MNDEKNLTSKLGRMVVESLVFNEIMKEEEDKESASKDGVQTIQVGPHTTHHVTRWVCIIRRGETSWELVRARRPQNNEPQKTDEQVFASLLKQDNVIAAEIRTRVFKGGMYVESIDEPVPVLGREQAEA